MDGEKGKRSRLGRGLEALIPREEERPGKVEVGEPKTESKPHDEAKPDNSFTVDDKSEEVETPINEKALGEAIEVAKKNPRTMVWSPMCAAIFRYFKKTVPEFSISEEAARLLEKAVKEEYPELWKKVESRLKSKS